MTKYESDLNNYRQRLNQMGREERLREYEWISKNPKKATILQSAALVTEVMEGDDPFFLQGVVPNMEAEVKTARESEWQARRRRYQGQTPIHLGYLAWKMVFAGAGALLFVLYSLLMAGVI